jgi:hypothetical protein
MFFKGFYSTNGCVFAVYSHFDYAHTEGGSYNEIGSLSAKKTNEYPISLSKNLNLRDKTEVFSFEITLSPIIYQTKCKKSTTVSKK